MRVSVIGCGPAGILAAYAALQEGHRVTVWSPPGVGRSPIHGAQYIHGKVSGLPESIEPFEVRYRHRGTEEGYRQKIYGEAVPEGGTSWGLFRPKEWAWSMAEVYEYLYRVVELGATMNQLVMDERLVEALVQTDDYVFNTAPLNKIKPDGQYEMETVYTVPKSDIPENEIWYFGGDEPAYRASNIAGHKSTEFPTYDDLPLTWRRQASKVIKPLSCKVELPGVYRLGRYGKWQKGVLAHHAYEEAQRVLQKRISWTATHQH